MKLTRSLMGTKRFVEEPGDSSISRTKTHRVVYLVKAEHVELRRVPLPVPGPGELLVRIGAATTCGTDVKVFRRGSHPRMLQAPTPFGHEMAGTICAVGNPAPVSSTTGREWQAGDRIVLANSAPCGSCERCRYGH